MTLAEILSKIRNHDYSYHNSVNRLVSGDARPPYPTEDSPDYDLESYISKYGDPGQAGTGKHLTDEFKLPNHMTFSNESIYSNPETQGGRWQSGGNDRWAFTPSDFNLTRHDSKTLADYFHNYERKNTVVMLPNGKKSWGTK